MLDQEDEGTRIGVWVALGVVFFVIAGLIGGLVMRQMKSAHAPAAPVAATAPAGEVVLIDAPLTGDLVGTVFFAVGQAALPPEGAAVLQQVAAALGGNSRSLVLSGFHDATGDPAKNAELAKQRAITARDALIAAGVEAARVKLRKPESTTGDGSNQEARRVEFRLVD